ncbi:hypothetical protein CDAR_502091 [Caerostris darwini]|uniref:Uncharacterized protein n=1 Tax=Caerostris darwini TaxID=1538125 RepID=A0AAV4VXI8_9ARAC|nr:hypothetical protein CDAR_502091 [Caerostris darwini]
MRLLFLFPPTTRSIALGEEWFSKVKKINRIKKRGRVNSSQSHRFPEIWLGARLRSMKRHKRNRKGKKIQKGERDANKNSARPLFRVTFQPWNLRISFHKFR